MTDIDQYQSRIVAALDRISWLTQQQANAPKVVQAPADNSALEAALADEHARLQSERASTAALRAKLDQERAAHEALSQQIDEDRAAMREAADTLATALADKAAVAAQLKAAEEAGAVLAKKLDEAERSQSQMARDTQRAIEAALVAHEKSDRLMGRIESQESQFQRLKDANATLRDSNANLREKNIEMLGDPDAINSSLATELAALKTLRAADVGEMDAILQELKPLIEGQNNA